MVTRLPAPFGISWESLDLAAATEFLSLAEDESLTWEAKGGEIRREHIREAASAFGNSILGGLLLLGATQNRTTHEWTIDHWYPPEAEVEMWVHNCLDNGGVTPKPSIEVKSWRLDGGGVLAGVAIWPVAVPPVITSAGQVWERTSGKSQKVTDPADLRRLFERGEAARTRVHFLSNEAADELFTIERDRGLPAYILGFAAASLPSEMAAQVFRESFLAVLNEDVKTLHRRRMAAGLSGMVGAEVVWNQGGVTFRSTDGFPTGEAYSLRVGRDGRVAVAFSDADLGGPATLQSNAELLAAMWGEATSVLRRLGALGPIHAAGRFPSEIGTLATASWSDVESDGQDELAAMIRDVQRGVGRAGWEPEEPAV